MGPHPRRSHPHGMSAATRMASLSSPPFASAYDRLQLAWEARHMDEDLHSLSREQLVSEVARLRNAIRKHRDATGHELCWHHPDLWSLLPEAIVPTIAVPAWPQFMRGCIRYRQSLEEQAAQAPRVNGEFDNNDAA
jgi:hypothetical protein